MDLKLRSYEQILFKAQVFRWYLCCCFQENSQEELDRWRLVRVSENFRVIALGVPVPRYPGNPLDPPLRSRFQARFIGTESFKVRPCYCRFSRVLHVSKVVI